MDLVLELSVATVMVLVTVAVHACGLMVLARVLEARDRFARDLSPLSIQTALFTIVLVLGLFILHGIEIWLYAVVFQLLGAVPDLREAVYFSTISYGAIGYGDGQIAPAWKLLGAIEGINGVILLGWSVAFFVTVMARTLPRPRRPGRQDIS